MPIIPRYQARGGPSVGGLNYAGAYAPAGGDDWRMLGRAAGAAGAVLASLPRPAARRSGPDAEDQLLGQAEEVRWRRGQLEADATALDIDAVGRSRQEAAQALPPGARAVFEALTAPREAGFTAAAAARAGARVRAAAQALSIEREALGVEEYHALIDTAPEQAMAALGSASAELGDRLSESGMDPEEVRAGQRDLIASAQAERVSRVLLRDPARAAGLLEEARAIAPAERQRLAADIGAEQLRRDVQREVGRWVTDDPALVVDADRLMMLAQAAGEGDEGLADLYQGAAFSAMRAAQSQSAAREEEAGALVERLLAEGPLRSWTDLPTRTWRALSPRQQADFRLQTEQFSGGEEAQLIRTSMAVLPPYGEYPGYMDWSPPPTKAAGPVASAPPPRAAINPKLGDLSRWHEVGKRGPDHIQRTTGDHVSYGFFQFTRDTARDFVRSPEAAAFADLFAGRPKVGSPEYDAAWRAAAARDPERFGRAQRDYFRRDHYDPFVADLKQEYGVDIGQGSYALQDVLWSTRVHHGVGAAPKVVRAAMANTGYLSKLKGLAFLPPRDHATFRARLQAELIEEIYKERGKMDKGVLAYFPSRMHLKNGLLARFRDEGAEALAAHKAETGIR
ncbi:MAG: hypothetical protein Q7T61_16080 [Caulobacter sp.]|nr:hypothetical protein [Caulobacter sp.]